MVGWSLLWVLALSVYGSIKLWKRGSEWHASSLTTFPCHRSVSWWLIAWTTMLMWPMVCPMNECVLCNRERSPTWVVRGLFFIIWRMCDTGWNRAMVNGIGNRKEDVFAFSSGKGDNAWFCRNIRRKLKRGVMLISTTKFQSWEATSLTSEVRPTFVTPIHCSWQEHV